MTRHRLDMLFALIADFISTPADRSRPETPIINQSQMGAQ
jgi:hypothetical protein